MLSRYAKCKDATEVLAVQNEYLAKLQEDERKKEEAKEELDSDEDDLLYANHNRETAFTAFSDGSDEYDSDEDSDSDEEDESSEQGSDDEPDVDTVVDKLGNTHIRQ